MANAKKNAKLQQMQERRRGASSAGFHFIDLYNNCQRKFYLRWVARLMPTGSAYALLFGAIFHEGKAEWYKTQSLKKANNKMKSELAHLDSLFEYAEDKRDCAYKLPILLETWVEQHGKIDMQAWEIIAVEKSVQAYIPGTSYILTGRIDLLAKLKSTDEYYIIDTKTSSFSVKTAELSAHYGDQATAYIWLCRQALDLPVVGFIPDIAYWNRKSQDIHNIKVVRGDIIQRSEQSINEFLLGAAQINSEIAQKLAAIAQGSDPAIFRRNTHYCSAFFKKCEFADICRTNVPLKGRAPKGFLRDRSTKPYKPSDHIYDGSADLT